MTDLFDNSNIPSGEPKDIIRGDFTRWRRNDLSDTYDPASYDLKYAARRHGSTADEIEITALSDADGFYVSVASLTSADYVAGTYNWHAYIERKSDSERIRVDSGQWTVLVNYQADGEDTRSHAKRMVDLLESVIEGRATDGVQYYMIGDRQISKIPAHELRKLLNDYRAEYSRELAAEARKRGESNQNSITVRFV